MVQCSAKTGPVPKLVQCQNCSSAKTGPVPRLFQCQVFVFPTSACSCVRAGYCSENGWGQASFCHFVYFNPLFSKMDRAAAAKSTTDCHKWTKWQWKKYLNLPLYSLCHAIVTPECQKKFGVAKSGLIFSNSQKA